MAEGARAPGAGLAVLRVLVGGRVVRSEQAEQEGLGEPPSKQAWHAEQVLWRIQQGLQEIGRDSRILRILTVERRYNF